MNIVIGHSDYSLGEGAKNFTWTSTIFKGYKQNIVSTFCLSTFELDFEPLLSYPANGWTAPLFVFVFTISNGPFIFKLKVRSALESFVYVNFYIFFGASGSPGTDQYLSLMWCYPSILCFLSIERTGLIVRASKLSAITPKAPFFYC